MTQSISFNMPVTMSYWDLARSMSNDMKCDLIAVLQESMDKSPDTSVKDDKLSFKEAKSHLGLLRLRSRSVPADFNGMRDEVNPKYM